MPPPPLLLKVDDAQFVLHRRQWLGGPGQSHLAGLLVGGEAPFVVIPVVLYFFAGRVKFLEARYERLAG